MQTFIVSSKNIENAKKHALELVGSEKVDKFDIEFLEPEKAMGIEEVRAVQKRLYLKPIKGDKKSVIIVLQYGATTEAQNAMLKFLEEPPKSTLIYLVTNNHKVLLPTILSRAKMIELKEPEVRPSDGGLRQLLSLDGAGDSLYLAQDLAKDKNEAVIWLENAILSAREKMLSNLSDAKQSLRFRKLIHRLELTHYDLKNTNANPRLALENLFLSTPGVGD